MVVKTITSIIAFVVLAVVLYHAAAGFACLYMTAPIVSSGCEEGEELR